eukprot:GCRY01002294.1.p1 GENE.GCRY01002294.1~~GCRY01002294.1.p1  ORF type:complete len:239 (+),score=55.19 GCRY01002294.1:173-889(+)
MSEHLGSANVTRRTWDLEKYEQLARERKEREENDEKEAELEIEQRREFNREEREIEKEKLRKRFGEFAAMPQRDFLRHREEKINLKEHLYKKQIITDATPLPQQGGYYCKLCECLLKDSASYLDHINGRRHQKKMGMSMRVVQSSVDDVRRRLQEKKQEIEQQKPEYDYAKHLDELREREEERKREKKEKRKEKKKKKKEEQKQENNPMNGFEDANPEELELMKSMGFAAGFGTSKNS